ncbi:NAD-dependent epimerase/dehydratase family protein [Bosea sp. TAF32]|uniref:NAD-dependent epimerase/dehydratase family protein n=1 Tax=Bosea sp. TAF32 TaxID=3237482 RepID=UPI003F936766
MRKVLVLGASGGIGGETARALIAHGWEARGLSRTPRQGDGIDWRVGDALDPATVLAAAEGVEAIVHAVNPPGYRDWDKLVMPMLDNSIAAALANGARLALPGTIYNYDPAEMPVAYPDAPQRPQTRKGAIRREMEERMRRTPGLRALILRAGDFFGPRPGNSWLSQGMIQPGKPVNRVMTPSRRGAGHAWAYLPDVAETFARLLHRQDMLPPFARYHFAGYWDADGRSFARAVLRAAGRTSARIWPFPWPVLPIAGLFDVTMRELFEMRPFWTHGVRLDNQSLIETIGPEPHTPLEDALRTTLVAVGCLSEALAGPR